MDFFIRNFLGDAFLLSGAAFTLDTPLKLAAPTAVNAVLMISRRLIPFPG
jgi:hypothetical protein